MQIFHWNEIQDLFDKNKLSIAFNEVSSLAGSLTVDTEKLKTYCEETVKLINKFITDIVALEKKQAKDANVNKFKEKLYGNDSLG